VRRQDVHVGECVSSPTPLRVEEKTSLTSSTPHAEDWSKAQVDFFEAFKAYDEAGSPQRIQVLKYLVLAHMLTESEIDPFDSQETKPCVIARLPRWCPSGRFCAGDVGVEDALTRRRAPPAGTRTTARSRL